MADLEMLLIGDRTVGLRSALDKLRRGILEDLDKSSEFTFKLTGGKLDWNLYHSVFPHYKQMDLRRLSGEPHYDRELRAILETHLFKHLDRPYTCTVGDCCNAFANYLLVSEDNFEEAFLTKFAGYLCQLAETSNVSEPVVVASGIFKAWNQDRLVTLWENGRFRIDLAGIVNNHVLDFDKYISCAQRDVFVSLRGECSPAAFGAATSMMLDALRAAFRSVQVICEQDTGEWQILMDRPSGIEVVDKDGNVTDSFSWIREFVNLYIEPQKEKGIAQRVRNAIHLLIDADRQSNNAVALALSMSAIEALLGDGKQDISASLRERCAALLEPEPRQRPQAESFVKKLYNYRSRLLHGDGSDIRIDAHRHARILAAGVLNAIVERITYLRRTEQPGDSLQDLIQLLQSGKYSAGSLDGVMASTITSLWRM